MIFLSSVLLALQKVGSIFWWKTQVSSKFHKHPIKIQILFSTMSNLIFLIIKKINKKVKMYINTWKKIRDCCYTVNLLLFSSSVFLNWMRESCNEQIQMRSTNQCWHYHQMTEKKSKDQKIGLKKWKKK